MLYLEYVDSRVQFFGFIRISKPPHIVYKAPHTNMIEKLILTHEKNINKTLYSNSLNKIFNFETTLVNYFRTMLVNKLTSKTFAL